MACLIKALRAGTYYREKDPTATGWRWKWVGEPGNATVYESADAAKTRFAAAEPDSASYHDVVYVDAAEELLGYDGPRALEVRRRAR